ncbi:MAG: YciI family protein [Vulcanimicrobiaceae bacterium]
MPRYLISFDAHAMDDIPDEDMSAVSKAAHEVVAEAMNAGVWVFGGGLESQKASVVAADGTVGDGPSPNAIGGFCVVEVASHDEALKWAAKVAAACRCTQEVREFMRDPAVGN